MMDRICGNTCRHTSALVLSGLLLLVLAACAGDGSAASARSGADVAPQAVEEVHAAFLAALRENDREHVLALTVEDQQALRADEFLQRVQAFMYSTTTEGPHATGGNLSAVQVTAIEQRGAVTHAWSLWQYTRKAVCHETQLTQTPRGWRVLGFYVPGDNTHCRADQ